MTARNERNEAGYALIATMGALTVMLILISGTLSTVAHELKRERETEMLFRGRQIVEAVARYQVLVQRIAGGRRRRAVTLRAGVWPQSLEALAEGITLPGSTRKVRLLRSWALKDPMNHNKPWKPVSYGDPALREYMEAYFESVGQTIPPMIRVKYLGGEINLDDEEEEEGAPRRAGRSLGAGLRAPGDRDEERESFIFGVVSESEERPVRDYYGLERYNQWVFVYIPELPIATGDEGLEMLTRAIVFPSDPLTWRMNRFARRAVRRVVPQRRIVPNRGRGAVPQRRSVPNRPRASRPRR